MKRTISICLLSLLLAMSWPMGMFAEASYLQVETPFVLGRAGEVVNLSLVLRGGATPLNNAVVTWTARDGGAFLTRLQADGTWVNPARVVTIDSAITHVNSGEYKVQVKLSKVSNVEVTVKSQAGELLWESGATIVGREAYEVEIKSGPLVATVPEQQLQFVVYDEDGHLLEKPAEIRVSGTGVNARLDNVELKETEQGEKVFEMRVMPYYEGTVNIYVATDGGNRYGSLDVSVGKPAVNITPPTLTAHVSTPFSMTSAYNDKDNKPLPFEVRLTARQGHIAVSHGLSQVLFYPQSKALAEPVLMQPLSSANDPEVEVAVRYSDAANWISVASIPVQLLNVEVTSGTTVVGRENRVDLLVRMSDGRPAAMRPANLLDSWGITDSMGRVSLLVVPSQAGTVKGKVLTDREGHSMPFDVVVMAHDFYIPQMEDRVVRIALNKPNPAIGLDQPAFVQNGRTMLPFRWFGEHVLGAEVDYYVEGLREGVTMTRGDTRVELVINSRTALVNGQQVQLDAAAFIRSGRTLVPARFLAETFGFRISWDPATDEIEIRR